MSHDPVLQAQREKAKALLDAVDRNARMVGMRPPSGARGAETLEVFTLRHWAVLAKQNGVKPPSRDVVALILRIVRARGSAPMVRQQSLELG